jgi:hypothetical protein
VLETYYIEKYSMLLAQLKDKPIEVQNFERKKDGLQ